MKSKTRCRQCPAALVCQDICYDREIPDNTCVHAKKYDKLTSQVKAREDVIAKMRSELNAYRAFGTVDEVRAKVAVLPTVTATLEERDKALEVLWAEFADIPMDPDTEKMEEPFLAFPAGTPRMDIWHWFDARHSKGVAALLYGDGTDCTTELSTLMYRRQLCTECDSEHCIFNPEGICMAPFLTGNAPRIHENGCDDCMSRDTSD